MFVHFVPHRLDSDMPEGVEIMNSTLLFLRPLQRNDSGVYRCEVANDINLRSRDVRILIQGEHTGTQLTPIVRSSPRMHVTEGIIPWDIVLQAEMWHWLSYILHILTAKRILPWFSLLALMIVDHFI